MINRKAWSLSVTAFELGRRGETLCFYEEELQSVFRQNLMIDLRQGRGRRKVAVISQVCFDREAEKPPSENGADQICSLNGSRTLPKTERPMPNHC